MKILLINIEFPPIGGGGSIVTSYVGAYLIKFGHDVHLVTSRYRNLPSFEVVNGIKVHRVPVIRRYKGYCAVWEVLTYMASSFAFCLRLIPQFRPDVIQAYFAVPAGGVAYLLNKIYKIPYCIYMGGSDVPGANKIRYRYLYHFITPPIKLFWRSASAITAASLRLVQLAKEADPRMDFKLIPNGVDLSRFKPAPAGNPSDRVKLLGIGRLIPRKGFQHVIQALPEVVKQAKTDFVFEIVGEGSFKKELRRMINELGLESYVNFVGIVPYARLHESYQNADVFVLTSLAEGMPCVVLEAMGCGLPIIASRGSGNEDIVHEGENGFLVEVGDDKSLAKALVALIDDPQKREAMGKKSLEIIKDYDWEKIAKDYDRIYREIVERKVD